MRSRFFSGTAALLFCAAPAVAQGVDSAAFVTVLGRDTLAAERWVRTADRVEVEVAVRSPRTSLRRGTLILGSAGAVLRWDEWWLDPEAPGAPPRRSEVLEPVAGGWARRVAEGDSVRETRVEGPPDALPWADLVHWPFDLAAARVPEQGVVQLPFLAGARPLVMTLQRTAPGELTITHPVRGPAVARLDGAGRIASLDAAQTTRKVVVSRVAGVDVRGLAAAWHAADRAGRGLGELSGRAQAQAELGGATIEIDHGTPMLRGRQVFGSVVPWGQVWRTGANRATHLTTSAELVLGGELHLPAGEYTLFSIPEAEGGWLIVNRQTGQNGTAYDPARDLGRVRMRRREVPEPVERFTIRVDPRGELVLAWDRSEFYVPVTARP